MKVVDRASVQLRDSSRRIGRRSPARPTSHIRIDTHLNCHASSEGFFSKLGGSKTTPSISENVTVEAEARGSWVSIRRLSLTE
jgi:hypothetical protein